jgi:hypothetical protein
MRRPMERTTRALSEEASWWRAVEGQRCCPSVLRMRTLRARSSSLAPFLGGTGDAGDGGAEGAAGEEAEEDEEEKKARRRVLS